MTEPERADHPICEAPADANDWKLRALTAEARISRLRALAAAWAEWNPKTYGDNDAQRVSWAKTAFSDAARELAAALTEDPFAAGRIVADLPCRKCGGNEVSVRYCDGCDLRATTSVLSKYPDDKCAHGDPEHMHRACRRCGYRWRTDDVIDARVVCSR